MKFIFLLLVCAIQPHALAHETHHHMNMNMNMDMGRGEPVTTESVYNINVKWRDQAGAPLELKAFKGTPVVLSMTYTHCTMACPMIVSEMKSIEAKLTQTKHDKTLFVLVSLDPKRDTPKRLAEFARSHHLDLKHWRLLTGSETGVRLLATALGIKYQRQENGDYIHSSVITALDKDGVICQQKAGLGPDDQKFITAVNKL